MTLRWWVENVDRREFVAIVVWSSSLRHRHLNTQTESEMVCLCLYVFEWENIIMVCLDALLNFQVRCSRTRSMFVNKYLVNNGNDRMHIQKHTRWMANEFLFIFSMSYNEEEETEIKNKNASREERQRSSTRMLLKCVLCHVRLNGFCVSHSMIMAVNRIACAQMGVRQWH